MSIKVIELFAGVGGFRLGLEGPPGNDEHTDFKFVWSNQWEPGSSKQWASDIYSKHFSNKSHSNEDIHEIAFNKGRLVETIRFRIPEHDLLVGGFPCQDYSVARTSAKGLEGGKGVLWWQIHRIMKAKKPRYAMLENVDRLLKSPTSQRGRDFAVMLASLAELGYIVEWRVINAADYGMPQRRRRVYILGYKKGSPVFNKLSSKKPSSVIESSGLIGSAFPSSIIDEITID